MVEACLSNYIQESLDAHKKPEIKRKDNELKSILGPQLSPNEIEMVIFMKKSISNEVMKLVAKNMIEIKLKDILLSHCVEVSMNTDNIEHAIRLYSESMKKLIKLNAFFKIKFDKKLMYSENITPLMIYSSLIKELNYQSFPIKISKSVIEFCIEIPDVCQIQQQFDIIKNIKVGGISGILNAKVITNGNISYIAALGCNISEVLKIPYVDGDKLLVSDVEIMREYFGLSGAIVAQSLMSSLKIRGVHFSYLNTLATARHCTGKALTVSRNGVSKSPRSILREIASGHPYENTTTAAAENKIDNGIIHSTVKSTLMGQAPMIASNYSAACLSLKELGKITSVKKKKTNYRFHFK